MPIYCMCPNGHRIAVHERFAGITIHCRRCREVVHVPRAEDGQLTDTAILRLLGDYEPASELPSETHGPASARTCPRCQARVIPGVRVCPACQVYLPLVGKAAG